MIRIKNAQFKVKARKKGSIGCFYYMLVKAQNEADATAQANAQGYEVNHVVRV